MHTVVFGYPGLRIEPDRLLIASPICIQGTTGSKLRGVGYMQSTLDIAYTCASTSRRDSTVCAADKPSELSVSVRSAGDVPLELVVYVTGTDDVADVISLKEDSESVVVALQCGQGDSNTLAIRPVTAKK